MLLCREGLNNTCMICNGNIHAEVPSPNEQLIVVLEGSISFSNLHG